MSVPASVKITSRALISYFAGGVCVAFLYGITTGQMAFYWSRSRKDTTVSRILVLLLWLLDGVHYVLVPCSFYALLVQSLHGGEALTGANALTAALDTWSFQGVFVVTGLTDLGVKSVFAYRIWKLSSNRLVGAILMLFSLTVFVLSCISAFIGNCLGASTLSCFSGVPTRGNINTSAGTAIAMLACVAISDIATSVLLCVFLWRRRTGFAGFDRAMRLLMLYSIEVGMLTSLASVGSLTTFIVVGYNDAVFISTFWVVPKLSINSLLALLNARHYIREEAGLFTYPSLVHDSHAGVSDDTLQFRMTGNRVWTRSR
ncbi:uncharacterized protein C8Q71DRAFT_162716 [Rhodofomes roseus]|uniref:DUF6534 domain-containing protein n=1 Tax=Rhodofomes roseus TaxID=34475 RepID=A0ABQ8KA38_9APHY|nr:uncharacterized protein C8Q71DRAFT_162716 [Rhodofomes roseus]KAH9834134.1 hypothetical protein C8Q71DRAFT_162716 [Rhodofomes roseus]